MNGSTAQLAMATIFASGGYHLLLGEEGSVLTEAYYPDNCRIGEHSFRKALKKYYDFITAYGGLLFPESWTDLTMQYAGGINSEFIFENLIGHRIRKQERYGFKFIREDENFQYDV